MEQSVREYELTNHLGNVLSTITDKGVITSAQDYFPFGLTLASRSFTEGGSVYRFGLNGQEKVPELGSSHTTAMFWEYEGKLGRRWNVDPVYKHYESTYSCFGNNPIFITDRNGDDTVLYSRNAGIKFGNFTKKGGDKRNLIYTVDELAKNFNPNNP